MGLKDPRAHSHCLGGSRKVFQRRRHKLSVKEYILIQHVGKNVQMLRVCRVGGGGGGGISNRVHASPRAEKQNVQGPTNWSRK